LVGVFVQNFGVTKRTGEDVGWKKKESFSAPTLKEEVIESWWS